MNVLINQLKIAVLLLLLIFPAGCSAQSDSRNWQKLADGLHIGNFNAPIKSGSDDSKISVLKIDPDFNEINILCASEYGKKLRTASEWAKEFELTACINAGMYAKDYLTSIGLLKSDTHFNNNRLNKSYNSIFACGPLEAGLPPVAIIDRKCEDFSELEDKYSFLLQSIRMISCQQENVWQQQQKKWSIAALGIDGEGNLLFIHSKSPYTVHDLINILLSLPINIQRAMYLEGGPQASLFYQGKEGAVELNGGYDTGFLLGNENTPARQIPNIIGVKAKD